MTIEDHVGKFEYKLDRYEGVKLELSFSAMVS